MSSVPFGEYFITTGDDINAQKEAEIALIKSEQKDPKIDIVISDMKMPSMSGLEFIREAKISYPDKKYFILTGYSINDEIQEALDSNLIIQYFMKPADFEEIDEALQALIK